MRIETTGIRLLNIEMGRKATILLSELVDQGIEIAMVHRPVYQGYVDIYVAPDQYELAQEILRNA